MRRWREALDAPVLFAGFAILFWLGRSSSFGVGDSPQHALAALRFIVPHPPGYPLQSSLAALIGDANGLSGLFHAAAAAVLFLSLRSAGIRRPAALIGAALMALSPLFWYYSLVAEVRALNDLLALAAAWGAAEWARTGKPRSLAFFSVVLGLGASHHPTFVVLLPAYAVWLSARRPSNALAAKCAALAAAGLAAPYALLGLRLSGSAPVYNLFEISGWRDLPGLFLRSGLGGPLRMTGAAAPLGSTAFDFARLAEHAGWFVSSLWTHAGPAGLALAGAGVWELRGKQNRELAAWSMWAISAILPFLIFSSQQMPGIDPEYARAVATRFHLLPLIAVFALAGFGAHRALESIRPAFGAVLLATVLLGPLVLCPLSLEKRSPLLDYTRAMIRDSAPGDFLVLGADDTIFATLHLELAGRETGGRVFLAPSMFSFPPYVRRLRRTYPEAVLPANEAGELSLNWALWKKLNPGRAVLAEPSLKAAVLAGFPLSVPQGGLIRVESVPRRADPASDARRFVDSLATAPFTRADVLPWTQEVYILKSRRSMAEWLASRLDPKTDRELGQRLALLMESL
ncbi:MAG: DUF2723 domain-containing protein [Elusimicrobia bacterium]|nr:DUF2723 domain-containing protein [Elusimicrobiota bacterium]